MSGNGNGSNPEQPAASPAPTVDKAAAISGLRSLIAMQERTIKDEDAAIKAKQSALSDMRDVLRQYQKALAPLLDAPPDKLSHAAKVALGLIEK